MNSSLNWKNIVHKAKCSDFPWRTHCQKNLILTVVALSLTRVSHSDTIFSESLPLTFVFRTMVECKIAKCWQLPLTKRKDFGNAVLLNCFTCGLLGFFLFFFFCPLWEYSHLILICINKEMEISNHKDIRFIKKKKMLATSLRIQALGVLEFSHWAIAEPF